VFKFTVSEWVSEWGCLTPREHFYQLLSLKEYVTFWWNNYDICFVLEQRVELEFYSAHWLKQQFTDSNVAPLGHIILIQSQLVFVPTLADKQRLQILQPLDWFDRGSNPRSTVLGASTLTIKLTTVSWGSKWRHTEGTDGILRALTTYWGH
jgi:hypothetical protein